MDTQPGHSAFPHTPIAACGWCPAPLPVALAACAFLLPMPAAGATVIDIQLTPAGEFRPSDGREMPTGAWRIDAAAAARIIERVNGRANPVVVDYEHQTLLKDKNGQPAPAAAWICSLTWREGSGLWATVELTARAAGLIRNGEYRYVSPVFTFDPQTGEVTDILMAAITNRPAIDGMAPLAVAAASLFGYTPFHPQQETAPMNKLFAALCAALALDAAKTTEDQAVAACTALKAKLDALDKVGAALGVAQGGDVLAACAALKTQAATAGQPDPARFVAVGVVEELKGQIAALTAKHVDREVGELVEAGLADGRLLEPQRQWASDLGKKDLAALTAYLKTAQPIAGLRGPQTEGKPPAGGPVENGLTADELAVCTATGVSPKDFAAAKPV